MKNFVRRWLREHDTPEFGHIIVARTMGWMHHCGKNASMQLLHSRDVVRCCIYMYLGVLTLEKSQEKCQEVFHENRFPKHDVFYQ